MCILPDLYLQQLENAILHAASCPSSSSSAAASASSGSAALESSQRLDAERCKSQDGLANACLQLLRRRGWGGGVHLQQQAVSSSSMAATATAQYDAIAFYALTTLQRSPIFSYINNNMSTQLRGHLRSILLATISHAPNVRSMPPFFATKIAVLLALLMREEYPTHWTQPLCNVLEALHLLSAPKNNTSMTNIALDQIACMDMYLSFLDAINDEIVYPAADTDDARNDLGAKLMMQQATERKRREQAKDALRGFAIQEESNPLRDDGSLLVKPNVPLEQTDSAQIVGWLLNLIVSATSSVAMQSGSSHQMMLSLSVRAAATLHRYLSWVDIRLAMNRSLVQMLMNGLGGASSAASSGDNGEDSGDDEEPTTDTQLAVQCAMCLQEIVNRGMDEQRKLTLLTELSVFDTLCSFSQIEVAGVSGSRAGCQGKLDLGASGTTQIEAVAAAAELINSAGLALIQGWEIEPSSSTSTIQMKQCLELMFACLAYDSIDVSGAVVDLISRMLTSLEKKEDCWNNSLCDLLGSNGVTVSDSIVSRTLSIIHVRMKYPADFAFDYEDEEESEEEVYRESLRKLYQRIVRFRPQIVLCFMGQCLSSLPQSLAQTPTSEIECALRLIYHFGEGRRPTPGTKAALTDDPFRQIINALHRSDVSCHPHREVLLLYYDICVRYSAILNVSPDLLSLLLTSILSDRGLMHPHTRVRCRCCYHLLRLIKSVGATAMRPHIEAVVDGIQVLLFPTLQQTETPSIPAEEAQYLFETTGILLGTSGLDTEVQVKCITAVLTPHIRSIKQSLEDPELARNVEAFGEHLSMSISAIAQLSKGWQKSPPLEVQTVLMAALDICHDVLVALPSCPLVRNRTAVLLQRMILCVGKKILPVMPSFFTPLVLYCTLEEDTLDVSQLINQLCIKFKEEAAEAIDSALLPFLQKVIAIQSSGGDEGGDFDNKSAAPPHSMIEQLSIRKQAFSTLQHIAVYNVSDVLYSTTNVASLGDVLQLMNDGAISVPDPIMNKTCNQFFSALINQWGRSNDTKIGVPPILVNDAFFVFVYDFYVPGMLSSLNGNNFNIKDAIHRRVLAEFGNALWLLKQSRRGNAEFQSRVVDLHIREGDGRGRKGCPELADAFHNAKCGKDVEMILKSWKEVLATKQT